MNLVDGGAHARNGNGNGQGVTEKEVKASQERIADNLMQRLLSISQRTKRLSVLEACHPAGDCPVLSPGFVSLLQPSATRHTLQVQQRCWRSC